MRAALLERECERCVSRGGVRGGSVALRVASGSLRSTVDGVVVLEGPSGQDGLFAPAHLHAASTHTIAGREGRPCCCWWCCW